MPEIGEAQALVAALAEMDEVKAEVARRRRKTRLHAAYGNAMILAHGYGARETSAAFERARDTATAEDGFERLSAQYGLWAGSSSAANSGPCASCPRPCCVTARGGRNPARRASHLA